MPRAASAMRMPALAKARAIEALRPAPAPTISASWFSFAMTDTSVKPSTGGARGTAGVSP